MKQTIAILSCFLTLAYYATAQNSALLVPDSVTMHQDTYNYYSDLFFQSFSYDSQGLLTGALYESSDPDSFYYCQDEFQYNDDQVLLLAYRQIDMYIEPWRERYMTEYQYHPNGLTAQEEVFYFNFYDHSWMQDVLHRYDYDSLGRLSEEYVESWSRTANILYEHLDNKTVKHFGCYNDTLWTEVCEVTQTFSECGRLLSSLRKPRVGDSLLTIYTYDTAGTITEALTQGWKNGEPEDRHRVVYENNGQGLPVTVRFEQWNGQDWEEGVSQCYEYVFCLFTDRDFFIFQDERLQKQERLLVRGNVKFHRLEIHYSDISPASVTQEQPRCDHGITLYPNPASGSVTVAAEGIRQVELHNILGQKVAALDGNGSNNLTLDLSGLAKGVYLVTVRDMEGRSTTRKLAID